MACTGALQDLTLTQSKEVTDLSYLIKGIKHVFCGLPPFISVTQWYNKLSGVLKEFTFATVNISGT